jgi:hypothetical protein
VGRGQREDAPIATALEAMIAYDGVTRTEPAMKPPMVINPWGPLDPLMSDPGVGDVNDADPAWSANGEPVSHLKNIRMTTRPLLQDQRDRHGVVTRPGDWLSSRRSVAHPLVC